MASNIFRCRIAQNLPDLPLSAHLLVPIQRICRYPLHLSELVKHSKTRKEILLEEDKVDETMDSKEMFEMALNAMKCVTEMVNESKRQSENLTHIQSRFEKFRGPPLNVHSTRLFFQTDATRVLPNLWNNTYTLFLFDRQIIYCRKDLLRSMYTFKGRIFLDNCRILNLPDGRVFGVNLKNALRIICETRDKWIDFSFRSHAKKSRFLNFLSVERQFCGTSLFVSELVSGERGEFLSDDSDVESKLDQRRIEKDHESENTGSFQKEKISDSLPENLNKFSKDTPSQLIIDHIPSPSTTLKKRRLGNWFKRSKNANNSRSNSATRQLSVAKSVESLATNLLDNNFLPQSLPNNIIGEIR
jgi:Rho guanine nucleotide exchange factor 4/29